MSATRLAIALGANLPSPAGSPRQTLWAVRPRLEALIGTWAAPGFGDAPACAWSPLLDTAPMGGPPNQPGYCNAVVLVSGDLGDPQADRALALMDQLHGLERQFGRDRAREQRWGPRPLDLDLLFWEELRLEHPRLQLPHPRLHLRSFVLEPLLAAMAASGAPVMLVPSPPPDVMASLPASEPCQLLETLEAMEARKIRFERQRIRLPMGVEGTFGIIRHPGASLAVPITNEGQVVLLRQYRFAVQARLLEFPAGTLEAGEDPLESMQRELGEEAGYSAARWDALGPMLPCPGYSDEVIHCFLARDLTPLENPPAGDDDEDLEVVQMSPAELDARLASGEEWLDGKSVTAWFRAKQLLGL
jgi:ADP-ribose pyrophosphatase